MRLNGGEQPKQKLKRTNKLKRVNVKDIPCTREEKKKEKKEAIKIEISCDNRELGMMLYT